MITKPAYPLQLLLVFIAYFVAGRLAILLSIPPGYATAIWPAAGIALAACVLLGNRVWPGVLMGSVAVNLSLGPALEGAPSEWLSALSVPFVIGFGAALQAVVGSSLATKYLGKYFTLSDLHSAIKFVLLVCAGSCLINSIVGVSTLWAAGLVRSENFLFNWFTWWVGDALGVLVFSNLIFVFWAKPKQVWQSRKQVLVSVLAVSSAAMLLMYVTASRWELERQQQDFDQRSSRMMIQITTSLERYWESLLTLESAFLQHTPESPAEFREVLGETLLRNKGLQGIAWNQPVKKEQLAAFEALMTQEHGFPVAVTQLDENGLAQPVYSDGPYLPIRFIEPLKTNKAALGFDINSNPLARVALLRAVRENRPAATDPVTLVQETGGQPGVVVYFPVKPDSGGASETDVKGYLAAVFRVGALFESLLGSEYLQGLNFTVSAETRFGDKEVYRHVQAGVERNSAEHLFQNTASVQFSDQTWLVNIFANQQYLAGSRSLVPWAVLAGGMLFSGLLGVSLLVVTGQRIHAEAAGLELQATVDALRSTQKQLVEAEKIVSLGNMVAGMAHELNTPLGVAITAVSTLENDVARLQKIATSGVLETAPLASCAERIASAAEIVRNNVHKSAALVSSFKQVSLDQNAGEVREFNLSEHLADLFVYLQAKSKREGHALSFSCPPGLNLMTVPAGLTQVIYSLVQNSLQHAFAEGQRGKMTLHVSESGDWVNIDYCDNGVGLDSQYLPRIFEPFFTARRGAGGSGLGLHMVNNLVRQQLQGTIRVSGDKDAGLRFIIELPKRITLPGEAERSRDYSLV
ncbi:CHASE domain-containing protein [Spongiibacter sp. KMU-158]|uniref:histidine kinase n=2 Tax=Spongiibacter pelagi TaxID=2760804 RepID=A0A927C2S7_9GAMM|nr:CHASE domain-containing protein [Spongiibacter pelagi]